MSKDSFTPFIHLSVGISQAAVDMIDKIGALTAGQRYQRAYDIPEYAIRSDWDGLRKAVARASQALAAYDACLAANTQSLTGEEFKKVRMPTRGGPTEQFPDAPYCKPDQSCCDFCCGN